MRVTFSTKKNPSKQITFEVSNFNVNEERTALYLEDNWLELSPGVILKVEGEITIEIKHENLEDFAWNVES